MPRLSMARQCGGAERLPRPRASSRRSVIGWPGCCWQPGPDRPPPAGCMAVRRAGGAAFTAVLGRRHAPAMGVEQHLARREVGIDRLPGSARQPGRCPRRGCSGPAGDGSQSPRPAFRASEDALVLPAPSIARTRTPCPLWPPDCSYRARASWLAGRARRRRSAGSAAGWRLLGAQRGRVYAHGQVSREAWSARSSRLPNSSDQERAMTTQNAPADTSPVTSTPANARRLCLPRRAGRGGGAR